MTAAHALAHELDLLRGVTAALEERRADDADVDALATDRLRGLVVDAAVDVDETAAAGGGQQRTRLGDLGGDSGMKPWPPQPGSTVRIMTTSRTSMRSATACSGVPRAHGQAGTLARGADGGQWRRPSARRSPGPRRGR